MDLDFLGFHEASKPIPSSSSSSSELSVREKSTLSESNYHRQSWGISIIKKH
jgi:hypothetical protein